MFFKITVQNHTVKTIGHMGKIGTQYSKTLSKQQKPTNFAGDT